MLTALNACFERFVDVVVEPNGLLEREPGDDRVVAQIRTVVLVAESDATFRREVKDERQGGHFAFTFPDPVGRLIAITARLAVCSCAGM